ncbi:MAG: hypothetical protein JRH20_29205, partial [Deltaproteobacteria bacterium]|nr:hypothetical protein [Deltaproteobacteria bacterium]
IRLAGNARLTVQRSTIEGKKAALRVGGGARVTYDEKSVIKGRQRGRKKQIVKGVVGDQE